MCHWENARLRFLSKGKSLLNSFPKTDFFKIAASLTEGERVYRGDHVRKISFNDASMYVGQYTLGLEESKIFTVSNSNYETLSS